MNNVQLHQLVPWYQGNPYIRGSYRAPRSPLHALLSAFEWHNETLNIYTHFLPAIVWTWMLFSCVNEHWYRLAEPLTQYIILYTYAAGAFMGFASAVAHTFYIVNEKLYVLCWKLDFIGIIAVNLTHQILDTYILCYQNPSLFHTALTLEAAAAALCMYDVIAEKTGVNWAIIYAILSSTVLTLPAAMQGFYELSIPSVLCTFFVFLGGGVFYIGKIPERLWNPNGVLDTVNSHVLFHICIVASFVSASSVIPSLHKLPMHTYSNG